MKNVELTEQVIELEIIQFQYGARSVIRNYEDAYEYLKLTIDETSIDDDQSLMDIWRMGEVIHGYLCVEAEEVYKNGVEISFLQSKDDTSIKKQIKKFICVNKERFNPINFGIDYHSEGYDGAACFHMTKDLKWSFSLYSNKEDVDCSVIAKQFGGGGHKGAAGFIIDDLSKVIYDR